MMTRHHVGRAARWLAAGVGLAAVSYAAYASRAWYGYGRITEPPGGEGSDPLLDWFIPTYEVAERHHVRVGAPPEITLATATEMDLQQSPIIRAIFKGREWIMGSQASRDLPRGLLAQTRALGWGVLAEVPNREIVMGAVTQPWLADVVFRSLPPEEFAAFHEPDYVKIVWTLRVDPIGPTESVFRTETRVMTTDATARAKFRRYWSFASPGIILIRWMLLGPLKAEAERRWRVPGSPAIAEATP